MTDPRGPSSKIELRVLTSHHTAAVRETVTQDGLTEALGHMFQSVKEALSRQGVEPDGSPFARYHTFGEEIDLEAGVVVSSAIQPDGVVKPGELPAGPAAIAVHAGPYEGLAATYDAIDRWIKGTGRTASGGPWEIYLTDPSAEPDPTKWLTEIIWPVNP